MIMFAVHWDMHHMWCPPLRRRLIYYDLQEAREEERRREGRGEEQRVDKLGNYSSITGFATIRQEREGWRGAEDGYETS
jgi:hypothetical protein